VTYTVLIINRSDRSLSFRSDHAPSSPTLHFSARPYSGSRVAPPARTATRGNRRLLGRRAHSAQRRFSRHRTRETLGEFLNSHGSCVVQTSVPFVEDPPRSAGTSWRAAPEHVLERPTPRGPRDKYSPSTDAARAVADREHTICVARLSPRAVASDFCPARLRTALYRRRSSRAAPTTRRPSVTSSRCRSRRPPHAVSVVQVTIPSPASLGLRPF